LPLVSPIDVSAEDEEEAEGEAEDESLRSEDFNFAVSFTGLAGTVSFLGGGLLPVVSCANEA